MRAGLPPLYEGDQYAITDIERQQVQGGSSGDSGAGGFSGTDADFAVVTPLSAEDEPSVMDVKLPEDLSAMLEQSAKKLNKGLTGSDTSKQ